MNKFAKLFKKVGGKEILKRYARAHVLLYALFLSLWLGFSKKSLEILRNAVDNKILKKLRRKNKKFISGYSADDRSEPVNKSVEGRKIWVCWLQGMDNAPELVKKCYQSMKEYITDREIIVLTEDNYRDYVVFPEYIQKKIDNGVITRTHMSDLLRTELLLQYGGTWIDATVMITGSLPGYMLDSDLFFYQCLKPGLDGHPTKISNWFISAEKNNRILRLTIELLYNYWKKYNKLIDYFIYHDFAELAIEKYPDEWNSVIPVSSSTPHILLLRLFDKYDEKTWNAIKSQTCVHKLTYKFEEEQKNQTGTYYDKLIK